MVWGSGCVLIRRLQQWERGGRCPDFLLFCYNVSWLVSTVALGSKSGSGSPVYVDLAYIPNHCSGKTADLDFFRRVRASYYVVSGNDPANGEPSRAVLDALLEGKAQWGENLQVSSSRVFWPEPTWTWSGTIINRQNPPSPLSSILSPVDMSRLLPR